ncbi:MAG: hypothetical protein AAFP08_05910 [Bacteroidota bacterium]
MTCNESLFTNSIKSRSSYLSGCGSVNKDSLHVTVAKGEPKLAEVAAGSHFQFLRQGYYVKDESSTSEKLVFNKTVGLRSSFKPNNS